jgi:hypothetical protein
MILQERARQLGIEGWTPEHDAHYKNHELIWAAICYASPVLLDFWPWAKKYDKRAKHPRLRQLAIAGALIAAEIDRLKAEGVTA